MNDSKLFITTETPLAAFLIQSGFQLLEIQYETRHSGRRQGIFVFKNDPSLQEKNELFKSGRATINIVQYENAKNNLIDRLKAGLP